MSQPSIPAFLVVVADDMAIVIRRQGHAQQSQWVDVEVSNSGDKGVQFSLIDAELQPHIIDLNEVPSALIQSMLGVMKSKGVPVFESPAEDSGILTAVGVIEADPSGINQFKWSAP